MTIEYYTKQVYGNTLRYLVDSNTAIQWYHISGRKTIDEGDMKSLSDMTGVQFKRVFEPEAN